MTVLAQNSALITQGPRLPSATDESLDNSLLGKGIDQPNGENTNANLKKLDITRRDILKFEVVNNEILISTKSGCKVLIRGRGLNKKKEEDNVIVFSDGEVVSTDELLNESPPPSATSPVHDLKEFDVCRSAKDSSAALAIPPQATTPSRMALGGLGIGAGAVGAIAITESSNKNNNTTAASDTAYQSILQFAKDNTRSQPTTQGTFSYVGTPPTQTTYETAGITGVNEKNRNAINDALATLSVTDESINTLAKLQAVVNTFNAIMTSTGNQSAISASLTTDSFLMVGLQSVDDAHLDGIKASISAQADATHIDTVAELQALIDFYNAVAPAVALKVNNSSAITNDATLIVGNTMAGVMLMYSVDNGTFSETFLAPTAQGQHRVSVRHISTEGFFGQISTLNFTFDTLPPEDIDLSATKTGVQSESTVYVRKGGIEQTLRSVIDDTASFLIPQINATRDTDIARISLTALSAIDINSDSLIAPTGGIVKPFNNSSTLIPNKTPFALGGVEGVAWEYDGNTKKFLFSKTDGNNFTGAQVQAIEKSLKFIISSSSILDSDRQFSLKHIDAAGNFSTSAVVTVKIDNTKPIIDLIAGNQKSNDDAQVSYFNASHMRTGKTVAPDMALSSDNDITTITVAIGDSHTDPNHDQLIFGTQIQRLDTTNSNGTNLNIGTVEGISWSYVTDRLTFTKTDGSEMSAIEVQNIEKALNFQTSTGVNEGDRAFIFTHIDHAGNRSNEATVTITVDTLAPTATLMMAANGPIARISEKGSAYLVNQNITVTELASITKAANDQWKITNNINVNTDNDLNTTGLISGNYVLFAIDLAGNLSNPTNNHIVI